MTIINILAYATIGLFIGWISRLIVKDRGVNLLPSLAFGVLGSLAATSVVLAVGLAGTAFYAVVGSVGVLFTVNVFRRNKPDIKNTETL